MTPDLETAWNDVASQLRSYIRSRVRDHAAAEDLLQEIFLKAHRNAAQLPSVKNLPAWFFQIARNAITDYFRALNSQQSHAPLPELPEDFPDSLDSAESTDSPLENPEALRESFRRMIFSLPEPYRQALILTEYDGLTQKQLAERLGISISGAKSRVQRAREKLKETLLDCCALAFDRRGNIIDCTSRAQKCLC